MIWELPNLHKDVANILGEEVKLEESANDSEIKWALLEASDFSRFQKSQLSDSFFLSESEVSTVMDNIQVMWEKLHQTDKEK